MDLLLRHITTYITPIILALGLALPVRAADRPESAISCAGNSRLASGRWVKVSVSSTGLHRITAAQLSEMGFSDLSKVKVYGYGGARISDILSADTFIDDLPQTPSVTDGQGIVFYARGPVTWSETAPGSGKLQHSINPFSTRGYYYLSDSSSEPRLEPEQSPYAAPSDAANASVSFRQPLYHHPEQDALGHSGFTFLSESFLQEKTRSFSFRLTDIVGEDTPIKVWARIGVAGRASASARFTPTFTPALTGASRTYIPLSAASGQGHDKGVVTKEEFAASTFQGDRLDISIALTGGGNMTKANLHYIEVTYERQLKLNGPELIFSLRTSKAALSGATSATRVWDVTSPLATVAMNTTLSGSSLIWQNPAPGMRSYVAWNSGAQLPSPLYEGVVSNQNLHASDTPDMVIFTLPDWRDAAERLARHRSEAPSGLKVLVVDVNDVYNEFSSGTHDVQAFRKMLKMFYNRPDGERLRYALFFGRAIWDYRHVTPDSKGGECAYPAMPSWQTENSTDEFNLSYTTDDLFGFLDDGTSSDSRNAMMRLSVGRLPATTSSMAHAAVDKIINFEKYSTRSAWRNRMLVISDASSDANTFMQQSDDMVRLARSTSPGGDPRGVGSAMMDTKIYLDAYATNNGQYTTAFDEVKRALSEGVTWMSYIGHGSLTAWGGGGIMPLNYVKSMSLRRKPIVIAATCAYGQSDGPSVSGAEAMWRNEQGPIAVIPTSRSVSVSYNGAVTDGIAESLGASDDQGRTLTAGAVLSRAKNRILSTGSAYARSNAMRFFLIGDPAMIQAIPSLAVELNAIHDIGEDKDLDLGGDTPPHIKGGSRVRFEGVVTDTDGNIATDFNGEVQLTLYDALYDIMSLAHDIDRPRKITLQGGQLTMARANVRDGKWTATLQVPLEIANNNTAAALAMYAVSADNERDAIGTDRGFTVSGFTQIAEDKEPPVIRQLYLNHPSFADGDTTDPSPIFYASVSDNVSVNISAGSIGHNMSLTIDDDRTYPDLSGYFSPDFGACTSGLVAYPLSNLTPGDHSLTFTVWDTSDNCTRASLNFYVDSAVAPSIIDVYTDTNPASVAANFYVTHDRPDKDLMVGIEIFDLMGRRVWSTERKSYSDGNNTAPITWDLTTGAGSRVSNGIYLYRATIAMPGGERYSSQSRKLAVTSR